ncbi:Nitrite reductase [NAD(P)H] large subunit [[Actinomadura] parvosata subsp. kistnae]|uniref:assimilatory sulfite reductase (ferredoxin) n=2 Tax=Nonomuraea TaxID=83681 RepID=A0A1V0AIB7_9ACTN|nr:MULTISPECIES: nitrite reductase large subunit NirB [unclassified Nonomuraea]AQZ69971.1 nitrite reductase large subunit [Nonomuraea sp. ATCC 55076]NJP93538.1 nitrite reductase large subunit [Nonomuraea sp. FMUSA5-5]SPL90300.1 Nitrite reductase [NAD(P)H] large subunit [Actinomadura parvosata subsp. kistnae]
MNRIVVVGYGPTAHRLVETLAGKGFGGTVTVIGEEPRPAYDRVHLTSYLSGTSAEDLTYEVPAGITTRLNTRVTGIDREARQVTLADGGVEPYDVLVLATGSAPFVPPVPGAEHAYVYRTIEDLDAIRTAAKDAVEGVVVGGGLLGLEAADALRALGLKAHIVEMSPWLMPRQVDEGGGSVLKSHIEGLGLSVHAGAGVQEIVTDDAGQVTGLRKPDGTLIEAQVVVFSAGIRPRDELARSSGLEVGPRGGIVVDAGMRTSDPAIYAIGECALAGGMVYGLVGPCNTMAEVAADRIMGGASAFEGADMSTKLKLLGVEVAQFGAMDGALDVTYMDPVAGVYKKLFISDDAQTLLGGICVGDASPYTSLRPFVGKALPASPSDLLFSGAGAQLDLPDEAQVCSCNNVCAGDIRTAIADKGVTDVPGLKACTRAGTTCGSCVPMLKQLLEKSGVEVSKALCEHFTYSRAELFDIVRVRGITTFSELITQHGQGRGCDICKPAVASILASLHNGHVLEGERAALQDTNDAFLANIQKNGTYSVVPRIPGGEITPEKLIVIGEVARDFGLYTKITGGQRIDLFGARVDQLPEIWRRLVDAGFESGHAYGKALRTVKSCVGSTWCRYGVQDSVGMAIALELRYRGLRSPHKLKSAVSGCARECAEARSKDFGIIATEQGWNLYVGGNGGFKPRHADLLANDLTTDELIRTIDRFLMFYIRTADRLQRTSTWLESLDGGLDYLREVIMEDSLGICADLDAQMERHIATYADEWAATLDDPDKLSRFVSFVNAPGVPDPSIVFASERGQIKPVMAQ